MAEKVQRSAKRSVSQRTERLNKLVRVYRIVLKVGLTIMLILFVKSLLSQLPQPTMGGLEAFILLKLSLVGYMYCWFYGCNRDLGVQNDILRDAPGPSPTDIGIAGVIVAAFGFLFYVENPAVLSGVFIAFLAANVGGWVFLTWFLRPLCRQALRFYQDTGDRIGEIKITIFEGYMFGRWQWWRFAMGFALLIVLTLFSLRLLHPPFGLQRDVTFAALTFVTLFALEAWIWYQRLRLKIQWDGLDWLDEQGFIK